jgi:hypothetical protein
MIACRVRTILTVHRDVAVRSGGALIHGDHRGLRYRVVHRFVVITDAAARNGDHRGLRYRVVHRSVVITDAAARNGDHRGLRYRVVH